MTDQKQVLVIDDEIDAIDIVEAMLADLEGVAILSANDGDSGLNKVREFQPDLIILDIQMPGKSGFDVFSELKKDETTSSIPVVMLTGVMEKTGINFSADDMGNFIGEKPTAYIEKPVDPSVLQKTVSDILGLKT